MELNRYKEIIEKYSKNNMVLLLVVVAIMAMIFSTEKDEVVVQEQIIDEITTTEEYTQSIQHKLTQMITSIEGVGNASVLVTLEGGISYEYATEERTSSDITQDVSSDSYTRTQQRDDTEENYIIISGENGEQTALVKQQIEPEIKGVVVVCEGGNEEVVQYNVIQAVTTALDIPTTKVYVAQITSENIIN